MSEYSPSSLKYIDLANENVRQVVHEAFENIKLTLDENTGDEYAPVELDRAAGGLDRSAKQLADTLGVQYERQYHDDGCRIDKEDTEGGGHDYEPGCEFAEEADEFDGEESTSESTEDGDVATTESDEEVGR